MYKIAVIALNTFKEAIRNKILYILLIFALVLMASSGIISDLSISSQDKVIKDLGITSISVFGLLIAIFVGIGLVYNEIDKKTLYTIVSKPIDRYQFILGKYFGLLLTIYVNILIMTLFFLSTLYFQHHTSSDAVFSHFSGGTGILQEPVTSLSYYLFMISQFFVAIFHAITTLLGLYHSELTVNIMHVVFMSCVEMAIITSFAVLFSASSSPTLSAILTLFVCMIGRLNNDIERYALKIQGDGLSDFGQYFKFYFAKVASTIMPNLELFNKRSEMIYETKIPFDLDAALAVLYGIVYTVFVLMIAISIFRKKNFK